MKEEVIKTPSPVKEASKMDYSEMIKKMLVHKDQGNVQFKRKAYKMAIKHFSNAINIFETEGKPTNNEELNTTVSALYTNRSLAFHFLNQ